MPKLKVNNLDLNYEMTGKGQSVLFVHGLGSSSRDWEEQVNYFSKDYQVVTIDVRGHGLSDKPPGPYSIKLFSDDTAALITSLDLSPVHIAGISMGGMIAFQLAMEKIGEVLAGRLFPKADQEELRIKMVKRWSENDKRAYTDSFKA
ncbi:MAG: alpha/beta fold hydrolase, partial [Deltaproteobacteria bacterium]|nr:alpha/beta fold hydrolase [Deltaproteobacteria bacterium]